MVRHQTLFLFRKHGAFLFAAGNDRFKRHQQIVLVHRVTAQPHSAQSCFVDQVGKVGAHAPGGGLGNLVEIYVLAQADIAGVHLQRSQTAGQIGTVHSDAPVETAGAQQGFIQHLGAVCSTQHNDTFAGVKAIQFGQQLV